jgi:lipopolysaccharide biosynthesis glycosyltransferase
MSPHASRVIVSSCDEKYFPGLVVGLASILERLPRDLDVDIVIYDDGLSASSRAELERLVARARTRSTLRLETGFSHLGRLPVARHVNQSMYSRLLIPDLGSRPKRAIYFDADMFAVDDVSDLLVMELDGAIFGACVDRDTPTVETGVPYSYEALQLPPGRLYFNTGLLVIDVSAWREAGVSGDTMDYVSRWDEHLRCPDQEGINAVSGDRALALDDRYNFQVSGEGLVAATNGDSSGGLAELRRAAVVHFTGPKPWLNMWFSSPIWRRSASSWWRVALGSSLISLRTRIRLARIGIGMLVREIRRLTSQTRSSS